MNKNRNNHKTGFQREKIDYSFSRRVKERDVSFKIRIKVLIGGITQFLGILFFLLGLGFYVPYILNEPDLLSAFLVSIIPGIFLSILVFSIRKRLRYLRILKAGKITYGRFNRHEFTNVSINDIPVLKYFFDYQDESGDSYTISAKTHTNRLSDEAREILVYNPDNPEEAVLIDVLPQIVKRYILRIMDEEN